MLLQLEPHQPPLRGYVVAIYLLCLPILHPSIPPNSIRGSNHARMMSERRFPVSIKKLSIITILPARYISWDNKAPKRSGPVVGRFRTTEVIVAPEIVAGSNQPNPLITGFRAIRTGYLKRSFVSASPFARAVITYCFRSSSNKLPLRTRMSPAMPAVPITTTATQMCWNRSPSFAKLQAASAYSGEKSPVIAMPKCLTRSTREPGREGNSALPDRQIR